jgi:hypothetical protein
MTTASTDISQANCFEALRGPDSQDPVVYAVLNWRERRDHLDVACYQRLTPDQERQLREGRSAGLSDAAIFAVLFPSLGRRAAEAEAERVWLPLLMLTHEQLVALVQQRLGREVPGLSAMPLAGVRELWRALQK